MKKLIIVGAGGFGREAYYLAQIVNEVNPQFEVVGFLDDNPNSLDGKKIECPILGTVNDWQPSEDEVFVMGVASCKTKEKIANILLAKGAKFVTLIHPAALVNKDAIIGTGCVIGGRSSVGALTRIGNFVHVAGSMVGQDALIDDYSTTTGFANITNAKLGKRVFVGSHAVILNGLTVGDDAYICAGSIVFSKVKAGTKVIGNPAKRMNF